MMTMMIMAICMTILVMNIVDDDYPNYDANEMMTMTIVMTVWYAFGCEPHWSQRSEGLTEQTMEHDFICDDYDDDDGGDDEGDDDEEVDNMMVMKMRRMTIATKAIFEHSFVKNVKMMSLTYLSIQPNAT